MIDKILSNGNEGGLKCIDSDSLQLQGDSETVDSLALSIQFSFCDSSDGSRCLPTETSKSRLANSYIVILANQREFIEFDTEGGIRVAEYSRLFWAPLVMTMPTK